MLPFIIKKWTRISGIYLAIFLNLACLNASHEAPRIKIYNDGSYTFCAFYKLHTPLPHSDLLVEMIAESNEPNGTCHDMWMPHMRLMNLRFVLDGSPKRMKIWPQPFEKRNKYGIEGLEIIHSSIWYSAIKKLANDIGTQYYGKQCLTKKTHSEMNVKQTSSCVYIKPLKNLKLQTRDFVAIYLPSSRLIHMKVKVDVHLETDQKGRKKIIAIAAFSPYGVRTPRDNYKTIKFVRTKMGLKEPSDKTMKHFSKWYPGIKKVVERSVARYLRFKHRHNNITNIVKVK